MALLKALTASFPTSSLLLSYSKGVQRTMAAKMGLLGWEHGVTAEFC